MARIVAFLLVALISRAASACSCGGRPTAAAVFPHASVVVTGVVTGRHPVVISGRKIANPHDVDMPAVYTIDRVDIAVTQVFKGPAERSIQISELGCCICEYRFEVGESYLIFVHPHDDLPGRWMASFCWPTKPLDRAAVDLATLPAPIATFTALRDPRSRRQRTADRAHQAMASILRWSQLFPDTLRDQRSLLVWWSAVAGLTAAAVAVVARARRRRKQR